MSLRSTQTTKPPSTDVIIDNQTYLQVASDPFENNSVPQAQIKAGKRKNTKEKQNKKAKKQKVEYNKLIWTKEDLERVISFASTSLSTNTVLIHGPSGGFNNCNDCHYMKRCTSHINACLCGDKFSNR